MYTPKFAKPQVLSVSQLNFYIKSVLENDPRLTTVFLEGEISNFSDNYRSRHLYFSLKDSKAVVRAVMFAGNASRLMFRPENGMKVICRGRVSVYEPSGQYQLIVEDMQPQGVGALALAFEQLKKTLAARGMFDSAHKKPIPVFPKTVGVITSPTGAAVQDIRNVLTRRCPSVTIVLCPVPVQGDAAAPRLTEAVQKLGDNRLCDVIIIGRGGGSMEDLWAFNDEALAHAIYHCPIPVISAVGHETDFTICDFVSDLRAPTPSAAAELAVPDLRALKEGLAARARRLNAVMNRLAERQQLWLEQREKRTREAMNRRLTAAVTACDNHAARLSDAVHRQSDMYEKRLLAYGSRLDALNPERVLTRGYAMIEKEGVPVSSRFELKKDDGVTIRFSDGTQTATITGD